jgi:DNA-binding NarL/FixJ family response regulator
MMVHRSPDSAREVPVHLQAFVIEDNATIRENLIGTLEELTCVRVTGTSATEDDALDWLASHGEAWDLVIVDLFLKQGSGIHLAQRIQRTRPTQKIVVFSNYINASVRKRCAQLGIDAVFDKSTEIDSLVDYCAHQCYRIAQAQSAEI